MKFNERTEFIQLIQKALLTAQSFSVYSQSLHSVSQLSQIIVVFDVRTFQCVLVS